MTVERSEVEEAKRWAYDRLSSNGALVALIPRIYVDEVQRMPNGLGQFPYILGTYMGGIDIPGIGTTRAQTHADFQWRVVTEEAPTANDRMAERIMDVSLQTAVALYSNGWYITSRRIAPISRPEYGLGNSRYQNIGGIYRLWISIAP